MNCAGSVRKTAGMPNTAGQAAMMGTAAHKIVEHMLKAGNTDATKFHNWIVQVAQAGDDEALLFEPGDPMAMSNKPGWFAFIADDTMVNGVQMMIDEVERVKAEMMEPILYTERYLDGKWLDDRLGGTADVTLMEAIPDWIHLFDYKNGRLLVEVDDNEQMKSYAVFLLHEHPGALGVVVHLVQPNSFHEDGPVRTVMFTADELKLFELQMKEAADATSKPNAPLRAGDWCTFCPAKLACETFDSLVKQEVFADFAADPPEDELLPPPDLADFPEDTSGDEYRAALARKAKWIPMLDQLGRDVHARIQVELLSGNKVGDFKLVRGKSNRKWSPDEATAQKVLHNKWGIPEDLLLNPPEMKSPAQVEKLARTVGKQPKIMKGIVDSLAKKPPGKIVIAPGNDPRPAIEPATLAADDFAADPVEDFE